MCKHSLVVGTTTEEAKKGQMLKVGSATSTEGKTYGTFRETVIADGKTTACLRCVKDGTELTLFVRDPALRAKLRIGPHELVTMVDKTSKFDDYVRLSSGREILLKDLVGADAYVGQMEKVDSAGFAMMLGVAKANHGGDTVITQGETNPARDWAHVG